MQNLNTESDFIELLNDYNEAYRKGLLVTPKGRSIITESEYDALVEYFRTLFPTSQWFEKIEEEAVDETNAVSHARPMLSTEKAYSQKDLVAWFNRIKKYASDLGIEPSKIEYRITPKLDGLAGNLDSASILATRGNGIKGNNITKIFSFGVVKVGTSGLGEIVVRKSYFDEYLKDKYPHPRNLVAGIVNSDAVKNDLLPILASKMVEFVTYSSLYSWHGTEENLINNLDSIRSEIKEKTDYYIDGFVIEVVDARIKNYSGATNHHYRWQIAFKENGEEAITETLDITLQVGRTGVITPVLELTPILLSGAVIKRVTAHNIGMLLKRKIGIGSMVRIVRSGEVIPTIVGVEKEAEYTIPKYCPCCLHETKLVDDFLYCVNNECKDRKDGAISHFFSTLDNNDGLGLKNIQKITNAGFNSLSKILDMKMYDFINIGFGEKTAINLEKAVYDAVNNPIEDWRFLAALGISDLGEGDSKKLLKYFDIESLLLITSEELKLIKGFGPKTSISIVEGIQKNSDIIKVLINKNFNLIKNKEVFNEKLKDKKILFTGTLTTINPETNKPYSREEAESLVSKNGAVIQSSINKITDILVYGEKAGSKLSKAQELQSKNKNLKIYTDKEFFESFF